jgi:hypothetical protein
MTSEIKKKKLEINRINSINLWPGIWDEDDLTKRKAETSWSLMPNNLMLNDEIKKKISFFFK